MGIPDRASMRILSVVEKGEKGRREKGKKGKKGKEGQRERREKALVVTEGVRILQLEEWLKKA